MKKWLLITLFLLLSTLVQASPLPADQVFQLKASRLDDNSLLLHWDIKKGYFLYKDKIQVKALSDNSLQIGNLIFPKALTKTDKQGQQYLIYRKKLNLSVPILGESAGETIIAIHYQGCSDKGFCYPPEIRQVQLIINNDLALSMVNSENVPVTRTIESKVAKDTISSAFNDHHWFITLIMFFGFGLLLSFTPCVLPMVPVLSGIIVGHGTNISTRKAFFLSLSYVLSMSLTYAVIGAVFSALGQNVQILMQSPWVISIFSLIFIILSLSMFGFYELRLPDRWQTKIAGLTGKQGNGHYLNAAIMGCLSTLILSPCVTAPLIGALGYITSTGNIIFGSLTLFFLGLGMGTPLLLIGMQAGRWLPSAGNWMVAIKAFFGILLLAIAIFLMSRILPAPVIMGFWATLLIFSGIYCGALTYSPSAQEKFYQGIGIILLLYGLLILIGASMGHSNPLQPLARSVTSNVKNYQTVRSVNELQQALSQAKGKLALVYFYADWCTSCKLMENTLFNKIAFQDALRDFVWIKADVTANNAQEKALLAHYQVVAPPTFLFYNAEGRAMTALTLVGEVSLAKFLERIEKSRSTL